MAKEMMRYEDKETVKIERARTGVTLELSKDEANALACLVGSTAGGTLYDLYSDLYDQGFRGDGFCIDISPNEIIRLGKNYNEDS